MIKCFFRWVVGVTSEVRERKIEYLSTVFLASLFTLLACILAFLTYLLRDILCEKIHC